MNRKQFIANIFSIFGFSQTEINHQNIAKDSERLRIDSSGKVGVGVISPSTTLKLNLK
jgi:hypothetical protein